MTTTFPTKCAAILTPGNLAGSSLTVAALARLTGDPLTQDVTLAPGDLVASIVAPVTGYVIDIEVREVVDGATWPLHEEQPEVGDLLMIGGTPELTGEVGALVAVCVAPGKITPLSAGAFLAAFGRVSDIGMVAEAGFHGIAAGLRSLADLVDNMATALRHASLGTLNELGEPTP